MTANLFASILENNKKDESIDTLKQVVDALMVGNGNCLKTFVSDAEIQKAVIEIYAQDKIKFERLKLLLKEKGSTEKDVKSIEKVLKDQMKSDGRSFNENQVDSEKYICEILHDDNVPRSYILPMDYKMNSNGQITTLGKNVQLVSQFPVVIFSKFRDIDTKGVVLNVGWKQNGKWNYICISKELVARTQDISKLAAYDFPVTSLNAGLLVGYLAAFETRNSENILESRVTHRMGWHNDKSTFLWGKYTITKDTDFEAMTALDDSKPEEWPADSIVFKGQDVNDYEIVRGLDSKGSYLEWIDVANSIFPYHEVRFALYASFLTPFLEILNINNFTLDLSGESSKGKTSALKFAASVWGCPNEATDSIVKTWSTTLTSVERTAEILNGIPIFLDDTTLCGNVKDNKQTAATLISHVLYTVASGKGKSRGKLIGLDHTSSFKTILISTGEGPATSFTDNEGAKGRTLSFLGNPFGEVSQRMGLFVAKIEERFKNNYGHAGPRIVKFIMNNSEHYETWRNAYDEINAYLMNRVGNSSIAMRLMKNIAAVITIIPIVHAALPELTHVYPVSEMLEHVFSKVTMERHLPDRNMEILKDFHEYAVLNRGFFFSKNNPGQSLAVLPTYQGQWDDDPDWKFIGFSTPVFKKITGKNGATFKEAALKNDWFDLNGSCKGYQKQVSVAGKNTNLYCIKKSAFEEAYGYSID